MCEEVFGISFGAIGCSAGARERDRDQSMVIGFVFLPLNTSARRNAQKTPKAVTSVDIAKSDDATHSIVVPSAASWTEQDKQVLRVMWFLFVFGRSPMKHLPSSCT